MNKKNKKISIKNKIKNYIDFFINNLINWKIIFDRNINLIEDKKIIDSKKIIYNNISINKKYLINYQNFLLIKNKEYLIKYKENIPIVNNENYISLWFKDIFYKYELINKDYVEKNILIKCGNMNNKIIEKFINKDSTYINKKNIKNNLIITNLLDEFIKYEESLIKGGNLVFSTTIEIYLNNQKEIKNIIEKFYKCIIEKTFIGNNNSINIILFGFNKNIGNIKSYNYFENIFIKNIIKDINIFNKKVNIINFFENNINYFDYFFRKVNKNNIKKCIKYVLDNKYLILSKEYESDDNIKLKLITDNKMKKYLFPNEINIDFNKLIVYNVSLYSVTLPKDADFISFNILKTYKEKFKNINPIITDCTSNIGGNILSFSKYFKKVNSIEMNKKNYNALINNCKNVYGRKNIFFYNSDCLEQIKKINQNIIFLDPPWGGIAYSLKDNIQLKLGNNLVENIIDNFFKKKYADLIVLKCPSNINIKNYINLFKYINIIKIKNYLILLIIN
jgi:16S rRNA G966 N2-methylase RsmD